MESNKPYKEAIFKKLYSEQIRSSGGFFISKKTALLAMDEYSASQNSELKKIIKQMTEDFAVKVQEFKKENEELKQKLQKQSEENLITYDKMWNEKKDLESTIEEKDKEIGRLKGLLKSTIYERVDVYYNDRKDEFDVPDIQEMAWQQFKTENNL